MNKYVYLTVPIHLIPKLLDNKTRCKAVGEMVDYGIGYFLKEKEVLYDYKKIVLESLNINTGCISGDEFQKYIEMVKRSKNPIHTSISTDLLFNLRDNDNTDLFVYVSAASMAVKSILGPNKQWGKTSKQMIIARMLGYRSHTDMPSFNLEPKINKEARKKLESRRQLDNILRELRFSGHFKNVYTRQGVKGVYFNLKLSQNDFAKKIQESIFKNKSKDEKLKKENLELDKLIFNNQQLK